MERFTKFSIIIIVLGTVVYYAIEDPELTSFISLFALMQHKLIRYNNNILCSANMGSRINMNVVPMGKRTYVHRAVQDEKYKIKETKKTERN